MPTPRRLAVLGQPVGHSKSPALHRAAYGVLGLPWQYDAVELPAEGLAGFIAGLDASWRGLSLTMPHKQVVLPLLDEAEPLVGLTGAANTLLFADDRRQLGFNTDVAGIVGALREVGAGLVKTAAILGSGATAASALAAVGQLGARRVTLLARNELKGETLRPVAEHFGMSLRVAALEACSTLPEDYDAVVSTLPPGAADSLRFPRELRRSAALLDAAYAAGETVLARHWSEVGGVVSSGLLMLYYQAVEQVRIFVTGSLEEELPSGREIRAAMRAAVGVSPAW